METPLVTVVVPCYNERKYIEKCIVSILNQSIAPEQAEVLIVDGMSNDGTREILFGLREKTGRFRILDNERQKTPFARNIGIKEAKGIYIAILDAHSEYEKDYLVNSLKLFDEHPEISCAGGPIESAGLSGFGKATAISMSHPLGVGNAKHRFPKYEGYAEGACFPVFKRDVFNKIGDFDERFIRNQDDEFNLRMREKGLTVFISPKAKCTYYVRETPAALFKQYFNYGFWRMAVIKKHKTPMSFRQLVPAIFLISIIFSILISPYIHINALFTIFLIPGLYLFVLFIASVFIMTKKGIKTGFLFIFSTVILHISYALGFIAGFVKFIIKSKHFNSRRNSQ